jgi:hypothetical protein
MTIENVIEDIKVIHAQQIPKNATGQRAAAAAANRISTQVAFRLNKETIYSNMTIVYALVSRQKTVLAEYTATSGEKTKMPP